MGTEIDGPSAWTPARAAALAMAGANSPEAANRATDLPGTEAGGLRINGIVTSNHAEATITMKPAVTLVPFRPRLETTWDAAKLAAESSAIRITLQMLRRGRNLADYVTEHHTEIMSPWVDKSQHLAPGHLAPGRRQQLPP
jgi:hypothetical protein